MSNRLKSGLDRAFAPLKAWAQLKSAEKRGSDLETLDAKLNFEPAGAAKADRQANERDAMVTAQIAYRGIRDPEILAAMRKLPRHEFVPESIKDQAYADGALPIGHGQTISQPYIVALMTEVLRPTRDCRVLEIGTGCGYQSAVLAALCRKVYSIEIVASLADETRHRLARLGIDNVEIRTADGYRGWKEEAPFDRIIVTAAPDHLPEHLLGQLLEGGRMIIPIGAGSQELMVYRLADGRIDANRLIPVRFVPMTGKADASNKRSPAG